MVIKNMTLKVSFCLSLLKLPLPLCRNDSATILARLKHIVLVLYTFIFSTECWELVFLFSVMFSHPLPDFSKFNS